MRKRLPPLFSLQVFEVAARHGKFSLAAVELNLTQSAVSRQIKQLEDWCGLILFARKGPRVELTDEGQALLNRLTAPLNALHAAVYSNAETERHHLHINTLASIAVNLLLPQLPDFTSAYPDIHISLQSDYALANFPPQIPLVVIRYTSQPPVELQSHLLLTDRFVVVGTPALVKRLGKQPAKWPAQRLLRHTNMDWSAWTSSQDLIGQFEVDGMEFNDAQLLLQAVEQGMGLGIYRLSVAWRSLENGSIVLASPHICASPASYYLLYRHDSANNTAIAAFSEWIIDAMQIWDKRMRTFEKKYLKKSKQIKV
jgi:LysR family glycine cleavage system transcriptional activator